MEQRNLSILFASKDNPALVPSGYGKMAQYVTPLLQEAGWDVRLHCRVGSEMGVINWVEPHSGRDMEIWSGGDGAYGESIVPAHMARLSELTKKPALYLFAGDTVALGQVAEWCRRRELLGAAWTAVDWEAPSPQHAKDKISAFYRAFPMSRHGCNVLREDGLPNLLEHVHLGVNTDVWKPTTKNGDTMREMGYGDDTFNVFSCFANQWMRKGEREMLQGIGEFHRRHPEAKIRFYGLTQVHRDWDLNALAHHLGVQDLVKWSDDYQHTTGAYAEEDVAGMMNCADAVLSLGYEGFGLQTVEAMALNKAVIGFGAGATPELLRNGIQIPPVTDYMTQAMFRRPLMDRLKVVEALEAVWERRHHPDRWENRQYVLDNLTWKHTGKALTERLEAVEDAISSEEALGPPGPGPLGFELARKGIVIE